MDNSITAANVIDDLTTTKLYKQKVNTEHAVSAWFWVFPLLLLLFDIQTLSVYVCVCLYIKRKKQPYHSYNVSNVRRMNDWIYIITTTTAASYGCSIYKRKVSLFVRLLLISNEFEWCFWGTEKKKKIGKKKCEEHSPRAWCMVYNIRSSVYYYIWVKFICFIHTRWINLFGLFTHPYNGCSSNAAMLRIYT